MSSITDSINVFWFRRDLRFDDNRGLLAALSSGKPVLPLFIFDDHILGALPTNDHRVDFVYHTLLEMHRRLQQLGLSMYIRRGKPLDIFREILLQFKVHAVYCNGDHEPYGIERDKKAASFLKEQGVGFYHYLDHLVFGRDEVLKKDGEPYQVFTPYSSAWKNSLQDKHLKHYHSEDILSNFLKNHGAQFPSMDELALHPSGLYPLPAKLDRATIESYQMNRDYPAREGTTRLGVHLRFGKISIRQCVNMARNLNETWLNELIWREFYAMILWHYPSVVTRSFKPQYDRINWLNNEYAFLAWKQGRTGYPMVDAGMRQLNTTGYMHNRLRMITASFLSKHLLVDWRWGEAYFAEQLFDYELSSNNGGWQWSAGTGCDAAPYFRIFNPAAQQKRFDAKGLFVREWIPELDTVDYPKPIVEHKMARERCLKAYKEALALNG